MAIHSSILAYRIPRIEEPGGLPQAWASLVAQMIKSLPAVWEIRVWSLGWEDAWEKEMATHSSILSWKILWAEEPGGLQSVGLQNSQILLSTQIIDVYIFMSS